MWECFLRVTLQWGRDSLLWSSCWAVMVHGIVWLLIDWLIETDQKIEHNFPLSTLRCNPIHSQLSPLKFQHIVESQCLSSELPCDFQISVVLFDLTPKSSQRCHRIGFPCSKGCPWKKCLCVNPVLSSFCLQLREQHLHSQHKHILYVHTHEYTTRTRQTQHYSVMYQACSGCVRPRSYSVIPLFP